MDNKPRLPRPPPFLTHLSTEIGTSSPITAAIFERHISSQQWKQYDRELEKYYQDYESYLRRLNVWGQINDLTIRFDLWLANSGNSPAEDVDVFLILPPSLKWAAEIESESARFLLRPEPPKRPERPGPSFTSAVNVFAEAIRSIKPLSPQISELLAERDRDIVEVWNDRERYRIHAKVHHLKHGNHRRLGQFLANFASWEEVRPFQAEFIISASDLPEQTSGKIPFVIRVKDTGG